MTIKKISSEYWDQFYERDINLKPSSFVKFIHTKLKSNKIVKVIDIGCGNGRDTFFFYKKGYAYQWDIKQSIFNRTIQFIKLIPIEENSDLKYILLGIDIQKKIIYRLIEITKSETRTTLTLKNLKTNSKLNPNFFNFDISKYPDYYIND